MSFFQQSVLYTGVAENSRHGLAGHRQACSRSGIRQPFCERKLLFCSMNLLDIPRGINLWVDGVLGVKRCSFCAVLRSGPVPFAHRYFCPCKGRKRGAHAECEGRKALLTLGRYKPVN
eukprot:g40629.t1